MSSTPPPGARAERGYAGRGYAEWVGLVTGLVLIAAAIAVPPLAEWDVQARVGDGDQFPPLHGYWRPNVGSLSLPAILLALLAVRYAPDWAERLSWRRLLLASYVVGLGWLLVLALVDGEAGLTRVLGNPYEYLETARATTDVPAMLREYVDRIPYAHPDNWVTHVAGHPPGALLFFVGLVKLGLGGDLAAALVVTAIAATTPLAVLVTLRALDRELLARRAAPFLVLGPAAVFTAVSADALFAAVTTWGLAALALAATGWRTRRRLVGWSVLAGLLLGTAVMMSYGLPLIGLVAVAILVAAGCGYPLPIAAASAGVVVGGFAVAGFAWWEAFPVLSERYWDGAAADRPAAYWLWGNLAALLLSAGPVLAAALARLVALRAAADRVVLLLVGSALTVVVIADLSRMSKAEVERIWLPFVPWLLITTALLSERWRRWGLALQLLTALLLQHLLYTSW
ncbi:hypothetical protein [Nocardioides sp.]|uniref:hypothetical protein n=1 Tax=Nocardioides sp. TaxID=35761 RepID=UPI003568FECE